MLGSATASPYSYRPPAELRERTATPQSEAAQSKKEDSKDPNGLTESEKAQVEELKKRDAQVKSHEMAHLAAAGGLARGGPTYVYQTGPDGKNYAIGGSVEIDTSPGRTPKESIEKARRIRAAALAPNDPSPQDMKVAGAAGAMEAEAAQKIEGKAEPDGSKDPFRQAVETRYAWSAEPETSGFSSYA